MKIDHVATRGLFVAAITVVLAASGTAKAITLVDEGFKFRADANQVALGFSMESPS